MSEKNLHNICTWDDQTDCANCANQEKLNCKRDKKIATAFAVVSSPVMVITIIGMIIIGFIGLFLACLLSVGTFLYALKVFFCPKCVNFSCPFNTVPKTAVDEYLKRNPVMKEAWEKSAYKLG